MPIIPHAGYFDASGKQTDKVLSLAGAVAPVKAWSTFEREWNKILKREEVSSFHATDFAASGGEYKDWKGDKKRRAKFLHDLGVVFRNAASRLFLVNVEMDAWNSVNGEFCLEEYYYHPYALAGYSIVHSVREWRKQAHITAPIEYFFEDDDDGWGGLKNLCALLDVIPIRLPKVKSVQFQAADLLAWKGRIASIEALKHQPTPGASIRDTIHALKHVLDDIESLEKVLLVPGGPVVHSPGSLRKQCINSNIPRRGGIKPRPL